MLLDSFNASNETHVQWLKRVVEADNIEKKMEQLKNNPMKSEVPPFEMVHILFGLCAKYTKAIFDKSAHIIH